MTTGSHPEPFRMVPDTGKEFHHAENKRGETAGNALKMR